MEVASEFRGVRRRRGRCRPGPPCPDARARALGLPADDGLERVIEDYIEDFMVGWDAPPS